jgi:hypothetical protein
VVGGKKYRKATMPTIITIARTLNKEKLANFVMSRSKQRGRITRRLVKNVNRSELLSTGSITEGHNLTRAGPRFSLMTMRYATKHPKLYKNLVAVTDSWPTRPNARWPSSS